MLHQDCISQMFGSQMPPVNNDGAKNFIPIHKEHHEVDNCKMVARVLVTILIRTIYPYYLVKKRYRQHGSAVGQKIEDEPFYNVICLVILVRAMVFKVCECF